MKLRQTLSAIFLTVLLSAEAVTVPDTASTVRFESPLLTMFHHIRIARLGKHDNKATVFWNMLDSANHVRAEFIIPPAAESIDYADPIKVDIIRRTAGRDSLISSNRLDIKTSSADIEGISIILNLQRNGQASLTFGGSKATAAIEIPFDSEHPGSTAFTTDLAADILNNFLLTHYRRPCRMASFADIDELKEHLKASTDRSEGLWGYLDRNTDPAQASFNRDYLLATVRCDDGNYDIVYIDGNSKGWKPLQIKGKLTKTIFTEHFDLDWTAVDGASLSDDTSATIESDGNILRLDFPLLKSSVRLRRIRAASF